ncbi:hypothetical protein AKJ09_01886 [Labilithrix luteola]|uniref:Uncharacterized protein n=1 Tax=Labilithrix luteola TaxID=1391654 RepID=A0A0K1PNZ2_9BACT|nr:hypothetical protein AKJ09_01886 [Labilithrix luteola]
MLPMVALAAWGCTSSARPTRSPTPFAPVVVETKPVEGPHAAAATGTTLVWARAKDGTASSYRLSSAPSPAGSAAPVTPGIQIAAQGATWVWTTRSERVPTRPCDFDLTHAPAQRGQVTRATLVRTSPGGGVNEQLVVPPPTIEDANEVDHSVTLLFTLGPLLFIEEQTYEYSCGAHGSISSAFIVWDANEGKAVNVLDRLPDEPALIKRAEPKLEADALEAGGPLGQEPPQITELLPVFRDGQLRFEAQITTSSCYACSDGLWSSYTRSVRLEAEPPPVVAPWIAVPPTVAAFARDHKDVTIGGWSTEEASPPTK